MTRFHLLTVVNCAQSLDDLHAGAYLCPNRPGPYHHRHSRWLGAYTGDKTVTYVAEIDGVVRVVGERFETAWNDTPAEDATLYARADRLLRAGSNLRRQQRAGKGVKVFLLRDLTETVFRKDTPGGLQGSKRYFPDLPRDISNAKQLAEYLRGRTWSEVLATI